MRYRMMILLAAMFALPAFGQTQILTLEESLAAGLSKSKQLTVAEAKVRQAKAKTGEASAMMLPKLSFNAAYTRLSDVPAFSINTPAFPQPITVQETVLDNYQLRLNLYQPLFTGFRLSAAKSAAELNRKAEELEFTLERNNEAMNIHQAFWNYYRAKEMKNLVDENLEMAKAHLEDTKNFFEADLVARNDVLKVEVAFAEAQLQQIDAENNVELAKAAFNKALGVDLLTQTDIKATKIHPQLPEFSYDRAAADAMKNREELQSMAYRIDAGEKQITMAESNWLPSVALTGNLYYARPNQRYMPIEDEFNESWDVGVALQWNVWDWGGTASRTEQAQQQVKQLKTRRDILKDNITLQVYDHYLKLKKSFDKVKVSEKAVEQAEEQYRIVREKYDVQMATATDLIDAETELMRTKTGLTSALVEYKLAETSLQKAMGKRIY